MNGSVDGWTGGWMDGRIEGVSGGRSKDKQDGNKQFWKEIVEK